MTAYKDIKGTQVPVVSSNPDNPVKGQVWYNTTDQVLRGALFTAAWATGGAMSTGRRELAAANQAPGHSAGLVFGGYKSPAGPSNATEEYDGSSWTDGGDLSDSRVMLAGGGTQTAGIR